jgi:hypothetical protein
MYSLHKHFFNVHDPGLKHLKGILKKSGVKLLNRPRPTQGCRIDKRRRKVVFLSFAICNEERDDTAVQMHPRQLWWQNCVTISYRYDAG